MAPAADWLLLISQHAFQEKQQKAGTSLELFKGAPASLGVFIVQMSSANSQGLTNNLGSNLTRVSDLIFPQASDV